MGLTPAMHKNITIGEYASGHMVYVRSESAAQLKRDFARLIQTTTAP